MTSSFRHQLISEVVGGGAAGSWLEPAGDVGTCDSIWRLNIHTRVRRTLYKRLF